MQDKLNFVRIRQAPRPRYKIMESSASKKFNCPSCAAPLAVPATDAAAMECQYCGQSVIIPREMRVAPKPVAPPVPPVAEQNPRNQTWYGQQRARGTSLWSILLTLGVVLIAGFAMREAIPRWVAGATGSSAISQVIPVGPVKTELTFGGKGTGDGLFQEPKPIAVDGKGFVYVADKTLRVQRFDGQGKFVNSWLMDGKEGSTDFMPRRMAADRAGNVYVMSALSIRKYDGATGKLLQTIKGKSAFDLFAAFTVLSDGSVVVLLEQLPDDALVWYDASGKEVKRIAKPLSTQTGKALVFGLWDDIAADGLGNLFILHTEPAQDVYVYKFTRDGKYISRFGGKGDGQGQFNFARHLSVDDQSRVYVLDQRHISRFDADGRFLDWFDVSVVGNYAADFALAGKNIMYVIGMSSEIFKLLWSNPT